MSITNEVDNFISGTNIEAVTIPIDCHISRAHCVKHVVLKILESFSHLCFVHVYTIHDFGGISTDSVPPCQLVGQPTSLYHLAGKCSHTASQSNCSNWPTFWSGSCASTMVMISSISCSLAMSISSLSIVINLQTFDRIVLENHALILHGVLDTNARDLPCVW